MVDGSTAVHTADPPKTAGSPDISGVAHWIVQAGLTSLDESGLVSGVSERLVAAGVPVKQALVIVDTLHPIHEGHLYRWHADGDDVAPQAYGRDYDMDMWRRSPFFTLEHRGERLLRRRLSPKTDTEFSLLADFRAQGFTDYLALREAFGAEGSFGEMDCVYVSWLTDVPEGFSDAHVAAIDGLAPAFALALKSASLAGIARTIACTYLGHDAGRRVLGGRIIRGIADRIDAVLWFSDLRSYTRISDTIAPDQVIPLLNAYADPVVSAIHDHGGDVLKFVGDGVLALFVAEDRRHGCDAALAAATRVQREIATLNEQRAADGLVTTELYLGLHTGPVFYGNIGTDDRLDFTAVGPAVNEVNRIAAMCRSVDRRILMSSAFADEIDPNRRRLASVGRYALRGVSRPQELFTVDDG